MSGVFVSYGLVDHHRAQSLVDALRVRGYEVRWDNGRVPESRGSFPGIADEIDASELVVCLWSQESVWSSSVVDDAKRAWDQDKYLGVMLDREIKPPEDFESEEPEYLFGGFIPGQEIDWLCKSLDQFVQPSLDPDAAKHQKKLAERRDEELNLWYKVCQRGAVVDFQHYIRTYGPKGYFYQEAEKFLCDQARPVSHIGRLAALGWRELAFGLGATASAATIWGVVLQYQLASANTAKMTDFVPRAEHAKVQTALSKTEDVRDALRIELEDRVPQSKYLMVGDRLAEVELKFQSAQIERDDLQRRLDEREVAGVASFDRDWGPATATRIACYIPGTKRRGVFFANTCWPRSTSRIELEGVGLEENDDLSPLIRLNELEVLDLAGTPTTGLAPLSPFNKLMVLGLARTPVTDISALSGLQSLQEVDLTGTLVSDLSPLRGLPHLTTLCLPSGACIRNDREKVQLYLDERAR